jgi:hypothetical protein
VVAWVNFEYAVYNKTTGALEEGGLTAICCGNRWAAHATKRRKEILSDATGP